MDLFNKILKIYPSLTISDFYPNLNATIILQNDGEGDYIKSWGHPDFEQPSQQQLDQIK